MNINPGPNHPAFADPVKPDGITAFLMERKEQYDHAAWMLRARLEPGAVVPSPGSKSITEGKKP